MIALICSVDLEADRVFDSEPVLISESGSKRILRGSIENKEALLCIGGMGKVNATHAATLLTRFDPSLLLVFGIGGAYPSSGAVPGDVVVAEKEIPGDEGVLTADGFKDPAFMGIPLVRKRGASIYSEFPAPQHLIRQSLSLLHEKRPGSRMHAGTFVTLSTCTGTRAAAEELERRYHGLCENMEGAAVAQVAELHDIPWMEVRGISNIVEDRDLGRWNIPAAVDAVRDAVRILAGGLPL